MADGSTAGGKAREGNGLLAALGIARAAPGTRAPGRRPAGVPPAGLGARRDGHDSPTYYGDSLEEQCIIELLAMASYALATGRIIEQRVLAVIEAIPAAHIRSGQITAAGPVEHRGHGQIDPETGVAVPGLGALMWAHGQLAQVIAPAAPRSVLLLARSAGPNGFWGMLGPVPVVRRFLFVSAASLAGVVLLSADAGRRLLETLLTAMTPDPVVGTLAQFVDALFLLILASVGASFAALFKVYSYISEDRYDPKEDASYWIRYALGIMSGFLLATQLAPFVNAGASPAAQHLTESVLALVGGFSASAVYRILERISLVVEAAVVGDKRDERGERLAQRVIQADADKRVAQASLETMRSLAAASTQVGRNPARATSEVFPALIGRLALGGAPELPGGGNGQAKPAIAPVAAALAAGGAPGGTLSPAGPLAGPPEPLPMHRLPGRSAPTVFAPVDGAPVDGATADSATADGATADGATADGAPAAGASAAGTPNGTGPTASGDGGGVADGAGGANGAGRTETPP